MSAPGGLATSIPLLGGATEPTIFEMSHSGRTSASFRTSGLDIRPVEELLPAEHIRTMPLALPEVNERDLVAHFTRLSHRQYSVDLGAYPLGSCTMKYNPKICDDVASLPGLRNVHPAAPASAIQGWLELMVRLEESLCEVTGMAAATLQPAAGAAGELTGLLLVRAWHEAQGRQRRHVIVPDAAHGTNPASVTLGGYEVKTVPSGADGGVDVEALRSVVDDDTAGIMLTNPNTLGLFERRITEIAAIMHERGALLYYDGANLNAILGITRPGDMGFDIVHMNLHKTFATPHGGGGPGAGPVAVSQRLAEFLPGPRPVRTSSGYEWHTPDRSIGRVHGWHGNAVVLARAYAYMRLHGPDGLREIAQAAVLNANWLRRRLQTVMPVAYEQTCMHEVVFTVANLRKNGFRAMDVAKALIDQGIHPPTVAFPLIVPEALMVEPTESESPETLEAIAQAFEAVMAAMQDGTDGDAKDLPRSTPVGRVDEAQAARKLILTDMTP